MNALGRQVAGTHYRDFKIQPVEMIAANGYDFFIGNILKYISRWRYKAGRDDLEKALHYAELRRDLETWASLDVFVIEISMDRFIQANGISKEDAHVFYALERLHERSISADFFIRVLRTYIANQFSEAT